MDKYLEYLLRWDIFHILMIWNYIDSFFDVYKWRSIIYFWFSISLKCQIAYWKCLVKVVVMCLQFNVSGNNYMCFVLNLKIFCKNKIHWGLNFEWDYFFQWGMIGILMLLFTPPFSEKSSIDLASFKLQANGKVSQNLLLCCNLLAKGYNPFINKRAFNKKKVN